MKKAFLNMFILSLAVAFCACDDSASGSPENGGDSGKTAESKGSFPAGGDPDFYCEATIGVDSDGKNWSQIKLNIPNYKGFVERIVFDDAGNGSQYYEESYFKISPMDKAEMCLEFEQALREDLADKNVTDSYCGEGVSYFVIEFEKVKPERLASYAVSFREDCEDYERDWEEGEYARYQK